MIKIILFVNFFFNFVLDINDEFLLDLLLPVKLLLPVSKNIMGGIFDYIYENVGKMNEIGTILMV